MNSSDRERKYHALTHASAPILGFIGGMTFLGPLVMWLAFKSEYPSIENHAKKALNFHITMLIFTLVSVLLLGVLSIFLFATVDSEIAGLPMVLFAAAIVWIVALLLLQFILPVVMAFKAYNGRFNKYPLAFPFFKV